MSDSVPYNETELLLRVAAGDERGFHTLLRRYGPPLFHYLMTLTRDPLLTEELVQDVFVKIWLTRENLGNIRRFKTYLFVVARNHAVNCVNQVIRNWEKQKEWERTQTTDLTESAADKDWQFTLLDDAINRLPPQQLKVWTMSRRQGLKNKEIAAALGLTVNSVKKYLQLAVQGITRYITERLPLWLLIAAAQNYFSVF